MLLELTTTERRLLLTALLHLEPGMTSGRMQADIDNLYDRIIELPPDGNGLRVPLESHGAERSTLPSPGTGKTEQLPGGVSGGRSQGSDQPQRTQESDHWAHGIKEPDKKVAEVWNVVIAKVESKPTTEGKPRQLVTFESPNGKGFGRASLWDEELFSLMSGRAKQRTTFYILRKGQWLNVVGIRG